MKKLCCFILVALLALLCATALADCATDGHDFSGNAVYVDETGCAFSCVVCGEPDSYVTMWHMIVCGGDGSCFRCGAAAAQMKNPQVSHNGTNEFVYNETHCWDYCISCGQEIYKNEHTGGFCDNPSGVCDNCGQPATKTWHAMMDCVEYTPASCVAQGRAVLECISCGTQETEVIEIEPDKHNFKQISDTAPNCKDPGLKVKKCEDCGTVEEETYGEAGECYFTQMFDETGHWVACTGCGEVMQEKSDHMIPCDKPGTCKFCKATGLVGEGEHWFVEPGYDEKQHWYVCEGCGEKGQFGDHFRQCTDTTGLCEQCGQPCSVNNHPESTGEWEVQATCTKPGVLLITCDLCGEQWTEGAPVDPTGHQEMERISFIPPNCKENGTETVKCVDCGVVETWDWETDGECYFAPVNAGATHKVMCTGCGTVEYEEAHVVSCKGGNTCVGCGATGVTGEVSHVSDGIWEHDANQHWKTCLDCGVEMYDNHWISCADGTCMDCGATGVNGEKVHWTEDAEYDANNHWWTCLDCGEKCWLDVHYISCQGGNTCVDCGATGVNAEVSHRTDEGEYDANSHWWTCLDCGEKEWAGEHHAFCDMDTNTCMSCGISGVNIVTYHSISEDDVVTTTTEHWWVCTACKKEVYRGEHEDLDGTGICYCGQPVKHEHTWEKSGETAATCTVDGKVDYKCAGCTETKTETVKATGHNYKADASKAATCTEAGYERTVCAGCGDITAEKKLYPTGHNWVVVNTVDATCTKDGHIDYDCRNCDAGSVKRLPATGHTLVDGACACGYTEEAPAEEPAEVTEEVAEVPMKVIENVTVEAATEGETISSDVALIVNEPEKEADLTAILPEEIVETVAKVYFVKLTEKGEEIEVSGNLKITIELEEGADLTGKKLMLLKEDGTLVEIEYEVVEGKLVFVTEAVGTFVLVDAPAE